MEVVEINPSQIRVTKPTVLDAACYDRSGNNQLRADDDAEAWYGFSLRRTQFTFSDENWLTAIGCDDLVLGIGEGEKKFGGGCVTYCDDSNGRAGFCPENDVGYPPGNGCCRTTVPKGNNEVRFKGQNCPLKAMKQPIINFFSAKIPIINGNIESLILK